MENNNISQIKQNKKASPMIIGLLTVVATLSIGASIGIVTGVINVPFTEACCILPPPILPPPPPIIIPPITILTPSCELDITAVTPDSATLSWAVVNTTHAEIDNGVGTVAIPQGSVVVSPTATTHYILTVQGPGGQANCDVTVTVTPPPPPPVPVPPVCTLTVSPTSYAATVAAPSVQPTLSWTTTNATSFTIDNAVGSVTPVVSGSQLAAAVSVTTIYTGTATGPGGTSEPCTATITVTPPPPPNAPVCTLSITPTSYAATIANPSIQPTLSWTTTNATSFTIDQGVGSVTPVALGSQLVAAVATTTTYTGIATGPAGNSLPCTATIVVTPPPPPPGTPICTLAATPTTFVGSGAPVLSWTTANATSFVIDNAIGSVTPVALGSTTAPTIATTTTYSGVATGPGGTSAPCTAIVTITTTPPPPVLACTLSASPSALGVGGGTTVLTYTTTNAVSFSVDHSIGALTPVAGGSTTTPNITSDLTFTGTATDSTGATVTCAAPVTVAPPGGGGCSGNCGGGGGGGHPNVLLDVIHPQALGFVYLSQIPYTGLDLGPIGTVVYWIVLVVWSLALAYLVLFVALPWLARFAKSFGAEVEHALNAEQPLVVEVPVYAAPVGAPQVHKSVAAAEPVKSYSSYDGFRSFAGEGALSIDDIVHGLAREKAPEPIVFSEPAPRNVEPVYQNVEPIYEHVEPIRAAAPAPREAAPVHPEVPAFLISLIQGEREAVFGALRAVVQAGADAEAFLTQVACALDDAYRARLEGTPVHAEVKRITDPLATSVLEKLVTSFASAVDSSYSVGITGSKLAITRALAVIGA